jgi:hypothetical protein
MRAVSPAVSESDRRCTAGSIRGICRYGRRAAASGRSSLARSAASFGRPPAETMEYTGESEPV